MMQHYDQVIVAVDRAAEVVARLMAGSPCDNELTLLLAEIHSLKGDAYTEQRELVNEGSHQAKAAQVEFQKGINLLEPLVENAALGPKYRQTLANLHHDLGLCFHNGGDLEKGEQHYGQALALYAPLVEDELELGSKLVAMQLVSMSQISLARIFNQTGRTKRKRKLARPSHRWTASTRRPQLYAVTTVAASPAPRVLGRFPFKTFWPTRTTTWAIACGSKVYVWPCVVGTHDAESGFST
jgi:hypothetical protein